ncbi:uncharacterized protein LOC122798087 [Protopterus annectens]|uniref:uncharacterized protein LOC122798087 n=1 Tax=Protopterus annectens TaxID=7888 RepID=UPI001CFB7530|nr:uncharacterized protein LOC122798087 [Protopterus annectens]
MINTVKSSEGEPFFHFERKRKFSAKQELARYRSENFLQPITLPDFDIWQRKPPDFTPKLYRSLNLPRKTSKITNSDIRKTSSYDAINKLQIFTNTNISAALDLPQFVTRFKNFGPYEANIQFVKTGQYPKDKYSNPKPHDFRQLETNIPDFDTSCERDPFNLKLKLEQISDVNESCHTMNIRPKNIRLERLTTHKPADPKWDKSLIFPKEPWPPKSASYTRHKRRQNVHSAFMDRVNEKLTKVWQEESFMKPKKKLELEAI